MKIWRNAPGASTTPMTVPSVVTIGNFDGVHRGHARVIERTRALAHSLSTQPLSTQPLSTQPLATPAQVVAVTFDPHPLAVVAPDRAPKQLTSIRRRIALLREAGADEVYVLAFGREISSWSPAEFVDHVLVEELKAVGVVVGENFRFGNKAAGDCAFLESSGRDNGFVVEAIELDGGADIWSSTLVRSLVHDGDVAGAARVLGHPHAIEGVVFKGDQRGRDLGFPTANLAADSDFATPADGVYAGWLTRASGKRLPSAISVGTNPTFDGFQRRVESYVLDRTDLELYGELVTVEFTDKIRGQEKFDGVDALIAQMTQDIVAVRLALEP